MNRRWKEGEMTEEEYKEKVGWASDKPWITDSEKKEEGGEEEEEGEGRYLKFGDYNCSLGRASEAPGTKNGGG